MKNRFGPRELSGAFGDIGTLIPFVIGYIAVVGVNPTGILLSFGIFMIIAGIRFKTPFPVQPMKAIGATAIASAGAVTPGMVHSAGLFSGLFWLAIGASGALKWIAKITAKPVVLGVTLGLGFSFMLQGIGFMQQGFALPYGIWRDLSVVQIGFTMPEFALRGITWQDMLTGIFLLALPQIPLTLGNAVIGTAAEQKRAFPENPISEKRVAIFKGIMNLGAPIIGGVPMCNGASGIAAHTRFGGKTGGTMIIIGGILLVLGLFFSASVLTIFTAIPPAVLGGILFVTGLSLAMAARDIGSDRRDFSVMLLVAGLSLWNVGAGFLAGLIAYRILRHFGG
ncbi:MAG: sulfate transporter [Defluviitaleaceae bacterium]|nr:sulfate transporter [Defluviitaleaceae bacterium]